MVAAVGVGGEEGRDEGRDEREFRTLAQAHAPGMTGRFDGIGRRGTRFGVLAWIVGRHGQYTPNGAAGAPWCIGRRYA